MSTREIIAAAAAVLVAAYVVWRWRKLSLERRALGVAVALALGVYASGVLSDLPDPKVVIEDIAEALGAWTYAAGRRWWPSSRQARSSGSWRQARRSSWPEASWPGRARSTLLPLIGVVWAARCSATPPASTSASRLGPPLPRAARAAIQDHRGAAPAGGVLLRSPRWQDDPDRALHRAGQGARAVHRRRRRDCPYRRFIPYSIVGTGLWATLFCTIGYLFWRSFDKVAHLVGQAIFGFGLTVAVIVGVVVAYRRRREISDWFVAHERHPLVRPRAGGRPSASPARGATRHSRRHALPALRLRPDLAGRPRARADHPAGDRRRRGSSCSSPT